MNYGEALKYQREQHGLSQSKLAQETGLKQQMISWWGAGKGLPNIDFCVKLADYYEISLDELIGRRFLIGM
ncbi:MAG: helix-turn-helix transcriptional regulator [Clostridiales bacterium]|nr:helix-turn-helix transcriptional regulator [Clostridiales bacterium]